MMRSLVIKQAVRWALVGGLWAAGVHATQVDELSLSEALEQLRAEGVETVYTSRWVADQPVAEMPAPGPPAERLRRLLAPLDLQAREVDGVWVVEPVRAISLTGWIIGDPGGDPVSGAVVLLQQSGSWVITDDQGHFRFQQLPAGRQVLEISRSGFQTARHEVDAPAGRSTSVSFSLSLGTILSEEVMVSAPAVAPPLGSITMIGAAVGNTGRTEQDLMAGIGRSAGVLSENGVVASVRGADPRRMSLILDDVEIIEPYHFRDMGGLAGAVGPNAIAEVILHRGSPPLAYGDQASGVLELITEGTSPSWSFRLSAGNDALQAGIRGSDSGGIVHLMANGRRGEPEMPPLLGELALRPTYNDQLVKLSISAGEHHDVQLQWVGSDDDFPFDRVLPDAGTKRFIIAQSSDYGWLRYQGKWGRSLAELTVFDVESLRRRNGFESQADLFARFPTSSLFALLWDVADLTYELEDSRRTERQGARGAWTVELSPLWQLRLGGEDRRETTEYLYEEWIGFTTLGPRGRERAGSFTPILSDSRQSVFVAGTWRPRPGLTLELGWRTDLSSTGERQNSPRFSLARQLGAGVLRADWSRVHAVANTYDLEPADNDLVMPGKEVSEISSVGYHLNRRWGSLGIELFGRRVEEPRLRFESIFKPVSRFPELEVDRIALEPERSHALGVEVSVQRRFREWQAEGFYSLARVEDLLDGKWVASRSDRRHSWNLSVRKPMFKHWHFESSWRGHSGLPTTPFDTHIGTLVFSHGLGEYNSIRLPPVHQLDIRLRRVFEWRGIQLIPEIGVDNLYDRRSVRGFALPALRSGVAELPVELGQGRLWRWGLEVSW